MQRVCRLTEESESERVDVKGCVAESWCGCKGVGSWSDRCCAVVM